MLPNINSMTTFKSVMILAGGKGTRFKEYTKNIPKPMIEVLEKPLIKEL